jgi:hypothetical protein
MARVATITASFAGQKKWPSIEVIGSSDAKAGEVIGLSGEKVGVMTPEGYAEIDGGQLLVTFIARGFGHHRSRLHLGPGDRTSPKTAA